MRKVFTSESVTIGHPDKICDQISDAVLDEILRQDPTARVACDVAVNTGLVLVMGEITTDCYADIAKIARDTVRGIGYTDGAIGFDADSCGVMVSIDAQSEDIGMGVGNSLERRSGERDTESALGAGDQGMMFGFATAESDELMPLPLVFAHRLTARLAEARQSGEIKYLRPDGKAQVTMVYDEGVPVAADTIVLSTQHAPDAAHSRIEKDIKELIMSAIPHKFITSQTRFLINATGRFVTGGPAGDSGLTGRKIIVDTYGGFCPHGGGAFSGKDPTKVDRSAAYMARYAAKNVVAAGLADVCQISIAYCIGKARPVSVDIDTRGTGKYSDEAISRAVTEVFDFRPQAIIETLNLRRPIYLQTARNGHFGKSGLPWECVDKTSKLRAAVK